MENSYHSARLTLHGVARSHPGKKRSNNEDACLVDPDLGLYAVADGMGGHAGGEVASQMALEMLREMTLRAPDADYLREPSATHRRALLTWLAGSVEKINEALLERAQRDRQLHGMGCTLDVALVRGGGVFIAHIGDSRIYALRGGALRQLTEDHTLGQLLHSNGVLAAEEVARHPQRNVLTRALGPFPAVQVDTFFLDLAAGDVFLLCSDGLYTEVPDRLIQDLLAGALEETPSRLVQAALDGGGRDNVTAVVVTVQACAQGALALIGGQVAREALIRSPLFSALTEAEILRVQKIATVKEASAAEVVVAQDAPCAVLYTVMEGTLTVSQDGVPVGVLEVGDPFGAMALLDLPASTEVRANGPVRLLTFALADVQDLFTSDPPVAAKLARGALARTGQRLAKVTATLALYRRAARTLVALEPGRLGST